MLICILHFLAGIANKIVKHYQNICERGLVCSVKLFIVVVMLLTVAK